MAHRGQPQDQYSYSWHQFTISGHGHRAPPLTSSPTNSIMIPCCGPQGISTHAGLQCGRVLMALCDRCAAISNSKYNGPYREQSIHVPTTYAKAHFTATTGRNHLTQGNHSAACRLQRCTHTQAGLSQLVFDTGSAVRRNAVSPQDDGWHSAIRKTEAVVCCWQPHQAPSTKQHKNFVDRPSMN